MDELYTSKAYREAEEEINSFGNEREGLEKFRRFLEDTDLSNQQDFLKHFYLQVWKESDYSLSYEDPEKAFYEEFEGAAYSSRKEDYLWKIDRELKNRDKIITDLECIHQDLEGYLEPLKYYSEKLDDERKNSEIVNWSDAESLWNRLRIYNEQLEEIGFERQRNEVSQNNLYEYFEIEVNNPVLADIGCLRQVIKDEKHRVLNSLPVENELKIK